MADLFWVGSLANAASHAWSSNNWSLTDPGVGDTANAAENGDGTVPDNTHRIVYKGTKSNCDIDVDPTVDELLFDEVPNLTSGMTSSPSHTLTVLRTIVAQGAGGTGGRIASHSLHLILGNAASPTTATTLDKGASAGAIWQIGSADFYTVTVTGAALFDVGVGASAQFPTITYNGNACTMQQRFRLYQYCTTIVCNTNVLSGGSEGRFSMNISGKTITGSGNFEIGIDTTVLVDCSTMTGTFSPRYFEIDTNGDLRQAPNTDPIAFVCRNGDWAPQEDYDMEGLHVQVGRTLDNSGGHFLRHVTTTGFTQEWDIEGTFIGPAELNHTSGILRGPGTHGSWTMNGSYTLTEQLISAVNVIVSATGSLNIGDLNLPVTGTLEFLAGASFTRTVTNQRTLSADTFNCDGITLQNIFLNVVSNNTVLNTTFVGVDASGGMQIYAPPVLGNVNQSGDTDGAGNSVTNPNVLFDPNAPVPPPSGFFTFAGASDPDGERYADIVDTDKPILVIR